MMKEKGDFLWQKKLCLVVMDAHVSAEHICSSLSASGATQVRKKQHGKSECWWEYLFPETVITRVGLH